MSDYNEHLISMAGGDGERDVLGEIEARIASDRDDFADGYSDQSIRDREHLLRLVKNWQNWADNLEPDCCCGVCGL